MKTIRVTTIQVPSGNCRQCKFMLEKKKYIKRINAYGREVVWGVNTTRKCTIFGVELEGYKKCEQCKNAEV